MTSLPLKRMLLGGLLLLLLLPALQAQLSWIRVAPLDGYFDKPPRAELTWQGLQQNSYQPQLEAYIQDRLGFRSWLLRLRNQLAYSLFKQTRVAVVVVGKDNVLFQPVSIEVYLGHNHNPAEVKNRVRRLKVVQDSLLAHGTQLLLVAAPGKARILPEMLPADYAQQPRQVSNYDELVLAARKYHLNILDAAALFVRWQDTTHFPLFPRGGTHWSGYGTSLVADTLFRRVEYLTHLDLPDFASKGYTVVTKPDLIRFTDDDLQKILNRMWEVPPYPMAYPKVVFGPEAGKRRVNALVIGDSFAQSFYNFYPYFQKLFSPMSRYWANYEFVFWPSDAPGSHMVRDLNLREQLAGRDIVLLITTEQNFGDLGFGFIDKAYRSFCPMTAAENAIIDKRAQYLEQKTSWEEAHKDDRLQQHLRERAWYEYEHGLI